MCREGGPALLRVGHRDVSDDDGIAISELHGAHRQGGECVAGRVEVEDSEGRVEVVEVEDGVQGVAERLVLVGGGTAESAAPLLVSVQVIMVGGLLSGDVRDGCCTASSVTRSGTLEAIADRPVDSGRGGDKPCTPPAGAYSRAESHAVAGRVESATVAALVRTATVLV